MKRNTLLLLIFGALAAWAQVYDTPNGPAGDQNGVGPGDPAGTPAETYDPSRGVARISIMDGDVSVGRGDANEVVAAALNAPLMAHDRLLTGPQSRTEVQLDHENILRVGGHSEVRFNELEYGRYQIQLATGTVTLTVLGPTKTQGEIDTPSVSVRPLGPGAYRISVRDDGTSEITVRSGEAEIYTPSGTEHLETGQTMLARGPAADPEFQMVQAIPMDDWDSWNQSRDQQLIQAGQDQYRYVSPEISGAEDLEGNGQWVYEQPYGYVWSPTVAPGWAPYRYGRWVWEDWYGWTWVSYDPWGWAPYHYGRWFWGSRGWCWYPGPIHSAYYWNPALVAFFGVGHGGFGIGWVPLAPYERFHPWWGRGFHEGWGGWRRDTLANNFNVYGSYRNARVRNGVTAVNATEFGRRGFNGNYLHVGAGDLSRASLVRGPVPVAPVRESYRLSDRPVSVSRFPQTRNMQFAQHTPAAGGFRGGIVTPNPSAQPASRGGWGRFGEPIHNNFTSPVGAGRAGPSAGWQRFNGPPVNNGGRVWNSAPPASAPRVNGPVRISPPIVSNGGYSAPRTYYAPPASGGYGAPRSFGAPAPTYRAPQSYGPPAGYRYSAPSGGSHQTYSAPRSSGGGGGGSHSSGGGGGHSGGDGGGGHHR